MKKSINSLTSLDEKIKKRKDALKAILNRTIKIEKSLNKLEEAVRILKINNEKKRKKL